MRNTRVVCIFACLLLCLLGVSSLLFAQSDVATVAGRVLDPNGAIIIEATVTAKNVDTGVETVVQTNEDGIYRFANLNPGNYEFTVSKHGFKVIVKPGVTLHLADAISLNFNMVVGALNETVTVHAGASMLNTSDASISTVVDQTYVKNMPLNGRSFQDLILLTPGIVTNTPQASSSLGQSGEFSVNGQRTESNNYTVDGVSANVGAAANIFGYAMTEGAGASGSVPGATALGTTQALVSVDDLQEFRVESSSYSAQYGRNPGGQFAFETKSGTNQWHGTASDYLRNDYFDATDYFTNWLRSVDPTLKKSPVRQNDFGATLGGPVEIPGLYNGRDKTFFHVSYEGLRLLLPQAAATFPVPDACMRGDAASCPSGRAPAASPLLPVVNAFPAPSPNAIEDAADGVSQFVGAWSNPASVNATSVRFDHNVSQKLRLFFRFSNTTSDSKSRGLAADFLPPSMFADNPYTTRTYTAGASSIFSSRLSNEFRLNYSSNLTNSNLTLDAFGGSKPADFVQLAQLSGPNASVDLAFFLGPFFLNIGQQVTNGAQRQWNLVDTVHVDRGRHQLSFGVDYRRLTPYAKPFNPLLGYLFGLVAGEGDVEQNTALIESIADAPAYPLYSNYSLFAQDEWKTTQRLSLSLGLRWDVNPPPGVTQGLMPSTISFQGANPNSWTLAPQGTPLWKTTWFNFAPRLGAAYVARNAPGRETVLRVGGGLFFDSGQQVGSLGFDGPGFSQAAFGFGPFPTSVTGPMDSPLAVYGYYPHLQLPYTLQWNASVEQALGSSQALTASYIGSHAGRLLQTNHIPASFATSGVVTLAPNGAFVIQNGLASDYDSAQLQYRRRLAHGLTALGSYTWSHCLDYGSSNANFGYQRGNCDFDVRHNFSGAFSYDLPNAGHSGLVSALFHHWGIDDRIMARSAFPVTLVGRIIPQTNSGQVYDAGLSFVPNQPIYLYGATCASTLQALGDLQPNQGCPGGRAINPKAFTSVSSGFGNTPRNFARGFGAWQMNLGVRREFPIYEQLALQFRAEAFNIFNHPNFGTVNGQFGRPTFGQATATLANSLGTLNQLYQMGGPRSMQFALKLVF